MICWCNPMSTHRKYTRELLQEAADNSISVAGVLRHLGLKMAGGTYTHIKAMIEKLEVDTTHFLGQAHSRGAVSCRRLSPEEIFRKKSKVAASVLRRALLESGRMLECEWCGLKDSWNEKPIVLEIDHVDGDTYHNDQTNLRFLCPNCHSQTPTHGTRNHKHGSVSQQVEDSVLETES